MYFIHNHKCKYVSCNVSWLANWRFEPPWKGSCLPKSVKEIWEMLSAGHTGLWFSALEKHLFLKTLCVCFTNCENLFYFIYFRIIPVTIKHKASWRKGSGTWSMCAFKDIGSQGWTILSIFIKKHIVPCWRSFQIPSTKKKSINFSCKY